MTFLRQFQAALLCFACASILQAQDAPTHTPEGAVLAALERMDAQKLEHLSFTLSEKSSEVDRVYRVRVFEEHNTEETLLTIKGLTPTPKEIDAFNKERQEQKAAEAKQREEASAAGKDIEGLARLVKPGSIALVGSEGSVQEFSFSPIVDIGDEGETRPEILGRIRFNSADGSILSLEIYNSKPFKPDFKVKVRSFNMSFQFRRIDGFEEPVIASIETHFEATILFVQSVNETYSATFAEFVKSDR
jgi:hypothetical protein